MIVSMHALNACIVTRPDTTQISSVDKSRPALFVILTGIGVSPEHFHHYRVE